MFLQRGSVDCLFSPTPAHLTTILRSVHTTPLPKLSTSNPKLPLVIPLDTSPRPFASPHSSPSTNPSSPLNTGQVRRQLETLPKGKAASSRTV